MMARMDPALAVRIEALTGQDAACCIDDLQAAAAAIRKNRVFEPALARAKALGDERRFLAATLLRQRGEMCACEIQAALNLTHATVSHHMAALVDAGLVAVDRRGKWAYYSLTPAALPYIPEV